MLTCMVIMMTLMCRPTQNMMSATPVPVTNPFGTLPAMPQMLIGRSAGSGPSVQYGISSMPVSVQYKCVPWCFFLKGFKGTACKTLLSNPGSAVGIESNKSGMFVMQVSEKPTQVRTTSLLTPRHITQQSKVRMHARRYHPKKDSPKVRLHSVHPHCLRAKSNGVFLPLCPSDCRCPFYSSLVVELLVGENQSSPRVVEKSTTGQYELLITLGVCRSLSSAMVMKFPRLPRQM